MKTFDYLAVETIAEACSVLAKHGAEVTILAGGTDVLIELRRGNTKAPKVVLDVSRVPELGGIDEADDSITLRPLATHTELMRSDLVQKFAPLLRSAASSIGSPQIRDRGTVGGKMGRAAADGAAVPPLIALGATVTLQSKAGCRELALADLFVKPYQTKATPEELRSEERRVRKEGRT